MIAMSRSKLAVYGVLAIAVLTVSSPALAQAVNGGGMFADIQSRYQGAARHWQTAMTHAATVLFMGLATISLVWTMGLMALRRADLGEFFSEFLRFVIFFGFFLFLLNNGPAISDAIIRSMQQLGSSAASMGPVTPGSIVDIGFEIVSATIDNASLLEPVDTAVSILLGCVILVVLGLVAVNMLLLLVSAWILAYGGIFFLGFGGSRWTSDMAINYYKTVLGVAASLMAMILLVGIGKDFIDSFHTQMNQSDPSLKELAAMMVASVILLALCNKIPGLIAGIITGASVGGAANVGSFGAGAAMTAGSMAIAAAATGGAALAAGAANAAGGASAISAAFKSAQENMASGSGMFSSSSSGGGSTGGGSLGPDGGSPSSGTPGGGTPGGGTPMDGAMGSRTGSAGGANDNGGAGRTSATSQGGGAETATSGAGSPAGTPGGGIAGAVGEPDGAAAGSAEEVVAATAEAGAAAEAMAASSDADGVAGGGSGGSGASGGSGSGGASSGRGSVATAGLFAADMAANLGGGIARTASNKMSAVADAARARVAGTIGGQIANEIRNPGAAAAARAARQGGGDTLTPATGAKGTTGSPSTTTSPSTTGSTGTFGRGGSDGGVLDGDGGPSEAIGADPGGFGGDTISGSQRGGNPSTRVDPADEISEFVNRENT